ncbi:MAG: hypothetical protein ACOC2W_01005 [bacterium]
MNLNNSHTLKFGSKKLDYENWKVYHPNGKHMFTCGRKKAKWYLNRNLAKIIDGKSIKLTFTPKGNGFRDNEDFGRYERIPMCVVSGSDENLQRHHIIPYCYRTYFPEEYKSKNHHDVVLINVDEHAKYEIEATKYKDVIADMYDVKTITELNAEYSISLREFSKNKLYVVSLLHSIFKSYGKISNDIILDKFKIISNELDINYDFLCTLNYIQLYKLYIDVKAEYTKDFDLFKHNNKLYYDHGYQVVKQLDTHEKLSNFVKLWRKHFINTAKPQYMPYGWSIDFRVKTNI